MGKKNPIELEVDKIEEQWEEFVETQVPILRWLISPGSNQLVSTFIRLQEECDSKVSDLFMPLYVPMNDVENYAYDLVDEINQKLEESRQALLENSEVLLPEPIPLMDEGGPISLVNAGQIILETLGEGFEYLVFVLRPHKVSSARGWRLWCDQLAEVSENSKLWPKPLRIVLMDDIKYPNLNSVANNHEESILSLVPPVNLKQAMTQIFDDADDGSPGAEYRKNFVAMHHAVEEGNLKDVELYSEKALAVAGKYQWYDLWVAILLLRASAYLSAQKTEAAVYDYQTAQRFAKMGQDSGTPGCDKQWIIALLSEASAWLSIQKWQEATLVYSEAAELSERFKEHFFHMDSWRMVCFCQEKQKLNADAWQSGLNALEAAESLKEEERVASTLPYVGEALLRLAPSSSDKWDVDQQMMEYLGEDWLDMIAQPEAEAEAC